MSIISLLNSTFIPLNSNSTWTGAIETTNSHVTILSTIVCDTSCILNVYQSSNGVDIDFTDTFNILANVETNILQIQIKSKWFYISINNNSITNQTYLRLITKLLVESTSYFSQPPLKHTLFTTPETFTAGNVVTNSTLPLKANSVSNVLFRNVMYFGSVDASVNTNPKLIFQYSDNDINWFSDGVSASFYKPTTGTTWQFAFQRSSIGVAYVRLVAQTTTTIIYATANLSM